MATTSVVLLILLIGAGGYIAYSQGWLKVPTGSTVGTGGGGGGGGPTCLNNYAAPSGFQCVNSATLTFAANDGVSPTAGAIATMTLTVYNPDGSSTGDSGSTSSSGQYTTNGKYSTGQQIIVKESKTSYLTLYQKLTIPPALSSASPPTNLQIPIFNTLLGTAGNVVVGNPSGTVISTGQTYHYANTATTSLQVSWTISETVNNAGYYETYDPFNQLTQHLVMQASDGASGTTTITNFQFTGKAGTTTYYWWIIPTGVTAKYAQDGVTLTGWSVANGGFTMKYDSNSQTSTGGSYNFVFNVNIGSLASGSSMTYTFQLSYNGDPNFWINGPPGGPAKQTLGPNNTNLGSAFTILFANN